MKAEGRPSASDGAANDSPRGDVTQAVVNVIDAALALGVSLSRAAAAATTAGRPVADVAQGTPPVQALVHYAAATASNVVSLLTPAVAGLRPSTAASRPARPAKGPRARAGATLRVPLSVENPGDRPMTGLAPYLRAVRIDGASRAGALAAEAVHFEPPHFDVAPRDFEKLTVFVMLPVNASPGRYELVLALGPNEPDLPLAFDVVAPDAA